MLTHLLGDEDIRVRQAAANSIAKYVIPPLLSNEFIHVDGMSLARFFQHLD